MYKVLTFQFQLLGLNVKGQHKGVPLSDPHHKPLSGPAACLRDARIISFCLPSNSQHYKLIKLVVRCVHLLTKLMMSCS